MYGSTSRSTWKLNQEDRISKDSAISTSLLDEVERVLRDGLKPNLHICLPAQTDAGELAAWPLISVLDRWRLHGHTVGFVVSDEFLKNSDTAGRLALYDLGKEICYKIGAVPSIFGSHSCRWRWQQDRRRCEHS